MSEWNPNRKGCNSVICKDGIWLLQPNIKLKMFGAKGDKILLPLKQVRVQWYKLCLTGSIYTIYM